MAFNAATAQPESAIRGFDPSSAEPEEAPKASFKFDANSAVPEISVAPVRLDTRESPTLSAYAPPPLGKRIGTAVRESGPVSFLLGETPNQKLQREFAASQLDQMAPGLGSIMRRAENPHAEKSRSNGALATTWESANRPTIHLPLISTDGLSDERTPLMIGPTEAEAAGIYNAAAPIAESLTSPLSIGTFGTVSLLNKLAKGFGPAAAAARTTLRAMGLGFGAKLAQDTGEQAGQAVDVVNDPNATKAQKVAAVGAPILTGAASLASAASGVLPGRPAAPGPISDSELASARNVTPGSDADWSRRALEAKQPLALPEPQRALPAPAPSKPVETKGAPTADILPAEQVATKETTPAVTTTPFREGQEVVYSLPDGQEARGIVAAPTAYGRVKITTQGGENIRVPIERVRELPAEVNKAEGFDPSSAVAEIEVTLSEPDTPPPASPENKRALQEADDRMARGADLEAGAQQHAKLADVPLVKPPEEPPAPPAVAAQPEPPPPAPAAPGKLTYSQSAIRRQQTAANDATAKADQAALTKNKVRANALARAAEAERLKLAEMIANQAPAGRTIGVGLPAHGEPDLLNMIEEAGGVSSGEDLASTFVGAAKQLLRKSGRPIDEVASELHGDGWLPDGYPQTLRDAVTKALTARGVDKQAAAKNSFAERFENAFFGNQHPRKWLRAEQPVSIDDLRVGDRFEVDGEKFKVKAVSEDGVVTIEDGITREIQPGTEVFPDKGKVRKAVSTKKAIENFLPVEMEQPGGDVVPVEPAKPTVESVTASLPDAKAANEKVWYHGTGATLSDKGKVSSTFTKINSLFGTGFYLTDNRAIADSYGAKRGRGDGKTYAVRVAPRAVLNLELPMTPDVAAVLTKSVWDDFQPIITEGLEKGWTTAHTFGELRKAIEEHSHGEMISETEYGDMFQQIEDNLRRQGVDALTHVGGMRAGKGKELHRVLILLDPSNEFAAADEVRPKTIVDLKPADQVDRLAPPEPASNFSLEAVTPEQQGAEAAAKRELAQAQAQRDKITALAGKPLTGDSSDVGQGVLLKGDEDLFSGPSAEENADGTGNPSDQSSNAKLRGKRGAIDERALRAIAVTSAAGGGAAYGYSQGDTPEDRLRKAIGYGAAAGVAAYILTKIPAAFQDSAAGGMSVALRAAKNSVENALIGGKDLPNMRAASGPATDAAFRLANARIYGVQQGLNLAAKVLGDKYADPVFAEKLGSVLVQEMQEAKIIQLHDELMKARTPGERAKIQAQIDRVKPVWDMPATQINSPAEFQAALADPEIIAAIERHKTLVQAQAEAAHVALGGKLAAVGPNTGAFINTEAIVADEDLPGAAKRGDLQNVLKRKTAFGKGRTGTADQYEIDYNRQVARMAAGNAERLAKKDYYETLEREGLAEQLPFGERPAAPEKYRRERTQELSVTGQLEDTWIRRDVFGEHRQLMNTDSPLDNHLAAVTARLMNTVQLKSITDPTFHIANIVSAVTGAPGGGSRLADLGRQLPGVNVADALVRIGHRLSDVNALNPEAREKLAEIARIGALREGHPGIVQAVDQAGRLVMNDLFQNLVDEGLAENTEGNRRDFVNQIGQYNSRVMGKIKALFKEIGVSPFIVAGQNFNRLGVRRLLQQPGVKTTGAAARGKLVATSLLGTIVSLLAVPAAVNYLLNKNDGRVKNKTLGPTGVPLGAIGWQDQDEGGATGKLHYVDPLKWTNFRRGARMTGLNAVATGVMQDRDLNHTAGQAWEDIRNAAIHPWAGPAINAFTIFETGKSVAGFQEAELANPLDRTQAPTAAQSALNAKAAMGHLQPQVAAFLAGGKSKNPAEFSTGEGLKKVVTSLGGAAGYYEKNPGDAEHGAAESALYNEQLERQARREEINKVANAWPKMTAEQRSKATEKMTEIDGQDLVEALRQNSLGFTPADRMIHSMGVEDGARAKYLASQVMKLKGDEQLRYLDDKERKGLVTEKVGEQLVEELRARGWRPPVAAK